MRVDIKSNFLLTELEKLASHRERLRSVLVVKEG